ncbi:hypothetical protein [Peptostreptococcus stomatis]|uniref:hypothetical protein n=1 Tax=Peptostreptococcus stomatis TaxID=341694 RepID=UPI0026EDFD23|nr:hypothetical protein [Peptostreptococcus stomatis]
MLKKKKRMFATVLVMMMLITTMVVPTSVFAEEKTDDINMRQGELFEYNGVDEVYLGAFDYANAEPTLLRDNYREYDTYKVYDQGITSKWNWLSNPYFIISIAKGESYESSRTVTATISSNISGNFPSGAKKSIFNAFGISASGSKTVSEKVKFSGPTGSASTRDFYYQKGTHKHSVKVVQEHRSNWDRVLWTKTYYVSVNVPAIRSYSEDH